MRARVVAGGDDSVAEIHEFLPTGSPAASREPADKTSVAKQMFEALLDPRAIQWLMMLGGSLSVVGLIVWLVSVGAFDSPLRQAAAFGVGTLALFAAGGSLARLTRHRLAGEALAFLACVVAPLNLWFYHAQELVTVDGRLWMGGVVCCALYAATLVTFRRPLFLYAFQVGVTLTALLLIADFGEVGVTGLCLTLAILGAIAVHLERAFPAEGAFDRRRFGPPLLWTGLGQVAVALAVLLTAQILDWTDLPTAAISWLIDVNRLAVTPVFATGLWLVAAYLAFYAAIVPRIAKGWTVLAGALCLLMAEATVLIGTDASAEGAVVALALTSAVACLGSARFGDRIGVSGAVARGSAVLLSALPVGLGYLLFCRGVMPSFKAFGWDRSFEAAFPFAMTLVSACLAASAVAMRRYRQEATALRFLTAGGVLLAAAGAVQLVEMPWSIGAAILAMIPLAYLIEGMLRKDDVDVAIAYTAAGLFSASAFLAVCHQGFDLFIPREGKVATLGVAIVALEIAAFLLMSATRSERRGWRELSVFLSLPAAGAIAVMLWQGLGFAGGSSDWTIPAFAVAAVLPLMISRTFKTTNTARPLFLTGAALLLATTAVADLRAFAMTLADDLAWWNFGEIVGVVAACLVAAAIAARTGWRWVFSLGAIASTAVAVFVLSSLADLSAWQRLEVLAVTLGTLLLVAGHIGRFRDRTRQADDLVDLALWFGSGLTIVPLAVATFYHRFESPPPSLFDELALATFGLLMLATGFAWRFKATTLVGGGALGGYLVVLIASLLRRPEVEMGAYLAVAGTALFLAAVALSIYRDRLLALPDRIAKREGVFQVLDWR
ncbi:MAG: hypothetical protein WBC44_15450 [Planctomycetaceae bacterium]